MSRSERWATAREKKKILQEGSAGPVLYCERNKYYTHEGEGHSIIIGESGTGKTRREIISMIRTNIKNKESGVIADPKGEIFANTIDCVTDDYDVYKFDFRGLYKTDITCWNPLTAPYELWKSGTAENVLRAEQMVEHLAHAMYPVTPNTDPFWMTDARNVFEGAVFALFSNAKPEEVNLSSVYYFISKGEEEFGCSTFLKEFVQLEEDDENVAMQLYSYVTTASDTRGGIRSSLLNRLSMATKSKSVRKFLSNDDIHINELRGDKPSMIYVILPDETPIYEDLAGVLISQLMNHYIYIAENNWGGKLPIRINFCLDELGNIGKAIGNLDHLLSAGRSRNIRVALVLQSISQLDDIYGKSKAEIIFDNASIKILFRVSHWETLTKFSRLCGEHEKLVDGKIRQEPLIMPSQLAAMEVGQALVMISGRTKFITWLPDYTEIFDCQKTERTQKLIHGASQNGRTQVFNIQSYVREKKKQKLIEMMSNGNEKEGAFNVNSVIKRINARIAKLEEDEKDRKKYKLVILQSQSKVKDIIVMRERLQCPLREVKLMYESGTVGNKVELKGLSTSIAQELKEDFEKNGDTVILIEE